MEAISTKLERHQAALLGLIGAGSAAALSIVGVQGFSANAYATAGVATLALALLAGLTYQRPSIPLVLAIVFLTSPLSLVLSLQQSAGASAFLLAGSLIGFALRKPLQSFVRDPMLWPIAALAGLGLAGAAYGFWLGNESTYVLGDSFQLVEFALVYFLASQLLRDVKTTRLALRFWLASVLLTVFVELLLVALGPAAGDLLPAWEGSAISGVIVRTVDINATILFAVLFNLYPVAQTRSQRFWIRLALIPTIANIALSLSRGLWLCTLIAVAVSLLLQQRASRKRLLRAFAAASVALVLLAGAWGLKSNTETSMLDVFGDRIFYGVEQVQEGFAGEENMATRRFMEWVIVGPQVLDRPVLGHGLGATYAICGFAVLETRTSALIDHHFIHNLYLLTAFRVGAVGLGLLVWVFARYFRMTFRGYKTMPASTEKALVVGLLASVIGQLVLSATQPTITDHPTCAVIACAMALSTKLATAKGTPQAHAASPNMATP
jgi:hypothetical protein